MDTGFQISRDKSLLGIEQVEGEERDSEETGEKQRKN